MNQHTLNKTYSFEGRGLHTGKYVRISVKPAPANTGVVFVRTDLGNARIEARARNVDMTRRSTRLGDGKASVRTVEHLLSALTGFGVDNATVEVDGPELPILDGSAGPYALAFSGDSLVEQETERALLRPVREFTVRNKCGGWIKVTPAEEFSIDLTIDFNSKVLGRQTVHYDESVDYASQIAPCRTFCFLHEIFPQLMLGMIRGGDLDNALIAVERPVSAFRLKLMSKCLGRPGLEVSPEGYIGRPLIFSDECGRHKMLDLIGDLRLAGGFVAAHVEAFKPGHALNTLAAKELMNNL